jgi:hypothetical protein
MVYLWRERLGASGLGFTLLRTMAFGALALAIFNPGLLPRRSAGDATVLLDASLSMGAAGGHWAQALDSARVVAGPDGAVRFVGPDPAGDSLVPTGGTSRVAAALRGAAGASGPVYLFTDGEVDDVGSLPPSLLHGIQVVLYPRDTVADAALLDVQIPERVVPADTVRAEVVIGTWGMLPEPSGLLEVWEGERRITVQTVDLPTGQGVARRSVVIPAGVLSPGNHVLRFSLTTEGDREPGDDERWRPVRVSDQAGVVVLVDPADVEGRFLARELASVMSTGVSGYARLGPDRWVDMLTGADVASEFVRTSAQRAALLIIRGVGTRAGPRPAGQARWNWPAGSDRGAEIFEGDWYVTSQITASPLAARLATVEWDSLPPLTGVVPVVPGESEWVALTGRLGRRGGDQPLLIGTDSAGQRSLTTASSGYWRWAMRGGAAREAYRAIVSGGVDWLLQTDGRVGAARLVASTVVPRGVPVVFRWTGSDTVPDSAAVRFQGDSTWTRILRFDAAGAAREALPPGVYQWLLEGTQTSGVAVVEPYSDEFHPRPATLDARDADRALALILEPARESWWLFAIAMLALMAEWAWRQRRGLP